MDDERMEQENPGGFSDGFLSGWEEDGTAPAAESAPDGADVPGGDGGKPGAEAGGGENPAPEGGSGTPASAPEGGGEVAERPGGQATAPEGQPETPPPPRTWTLNHMGQAVTVGEADIQALAQKGLDSERVRAAYDEARPVVELFQGFARQAGIPFPEYVTRLRTQAKLAQGMEEAEARRAVELEDREARVNAQEEAARQRQAVQRQAQAARQRRQERVQADIQEFIAVYPDAARDFQGIPQEVWDAVNQGRTLVAAYTQYQNTRAAEKARADAEEEARREAVRQQNAENAARSAGSMQSAGNQHGPKDPFLEGWDE